MADHPIGSPRKRKRPMLLPRAPGAARDVAPRPRAGKRKNPKR